MRELNPRLLGVDQVRFRYTNRLDPHRHEGSNLDLQLRRLASCPLDDGGSSYPDQDSNLDPPLRRRKHCPLCYRGIGTCAPGRIRTCIGRIEAGSPVR